MSTHDEARRLAMQRAVNRANAEQQFPSKEMIDAYAVRFFLEHMQPPDMAAQMNLNASQTKMKD